MNVCGLAGCCLIGVWGEWLGCLGLGEFSCGKFTSLCCNSGGTSICCSFVPVGEGRSITASSFNSWLGVALVDVVCVVSFAFGPVGGSTNCAKWCSIFSGESLPSTASGWSLGCGGFCSSSGTSVSWLAAVAGGALVLTSGSLCQYFGSFLGQYLTWCSLDLHRPHWFGRPLNSMLYSTTPSPASVRQGV